MRKASVGDIVQNEVFGKGVVVKVINDNDVCYLVEFKESNHKYLHSGMGRADDYNSNKLYFCGFADETSFELNEYETIVKANGVSIGVMSRINRLMSIKIGDKVRVKLFDEMDFNASSFKFDEIVEVIGVNNHGGECSLADTIKVRGLEDKTHETWWFYRYQLRQTELK